MKKIKVGIISINKYSNFNYGAVLHSFAMQKYLDKKYIDSVIVDYLTRFFNYFVPHFPAIGVIKKSFRLRTFGLRTFIYAILKQPAASIRFRKIMNFCKKHYKSVNNNGKPFTQADFENNEKISSFDFDTIVCECDVIWSPKTNFGFDRAFFADYECFKDMKKVAYSPSIGNTILTSEEEQEFKKLVTNFDFLSSREKETAEYVQNLIGRKCQHVLDPTLLLDEQDYIPITAEINEKKKYLLCYNCVKNDKVMLAKAKELARKMNLEFIEISLYVVNKIKHRTLTGLGIEEWLGYFKKAEFIVTNGFHGMCFAIIFKKNFYVYLRGNYNLKFNLVYELGLENSLIALKDREQDLENISIDYNLVYEKLNAFRKISEDFINEAIVNWSRGV